MGNENLFLISAVSHRVHGYVSMRGGGWKGVAVCHRGTRSKEESHSLLKKNLDKRIVVTCIEHLMLSVMGFPGINIFLLMPTL